MERIRLVPPELSQAAQCRAFVEEFRNAGEIPIPGACRMENFENCGDWLAELRQMETEEGVPAGWVPQTLFFGVRESDGTIVGAIVVRHRLNDALRFYGGHIGYGVRPTERRKGYAAEMLRQMLEFCRTLGLSEVMISCKSANQGSRRTILGAGGRLEREFLHPDGYSAQNYWLF